MQIFEVRKITEEIYTAFQCLIPQLTDSAPPPSMEALEEMVHSGKTVIFLARAEGQTGEIIGSATLALCQSPTGIHAWIEDVVVDGQARKQGIGRALTQACLGKARQLGLREVNLTSRPSRQAANQLYQSMGFIRRETNVYRFPLD